MWQKSDGIPTTAWTGFHRIWTLVAFRKLSAVIYCVGIYVCVSLFGYAYNFEHYKLKTAESKASWSVRCWCATDNFVSRCSYLWLSYWREFFFLCLWKKTSWWPSTKYLFLSSAMLSSHPEGSLPSWILQACCTSMFGTWSLEGISSPPPCLVLIFACSL